MPFYETLMGGLNSTLSQYVYKDPPVIPEQKGVKHGKIFKLLSDSKEQLLVKSGARSAGIKIDDDVKRVSPRLLELIYARDALCANGVNVISKTFLSTYPTILNDHDLLLTQFLQDNNFHELLFQIPQHLCIYGNAWLMLPYKPVSKEDFPNVPYGKLMCGIDILDPKLMDFKRDAAGAIIFNEYMIPEGIVQYIPTNKYVDENMWQIVTQSDPHGEYSQAVVLDKYDIVHFSLYTIGDNPIGMGLLEPLYNIVNSKKMIERGYAQSVYRHSKPILHVKVGDTNIPPTPEEIDDVFAKVKQLNERSEIVTPYWHDIGIIEPKSSSPLESNLTYFQDEIISGMGIPRPFITGEGKGGSKHILEMQKALFEQNIKMLQYSVSRTLETEVFMRFARERGFPDWATAPPKLLWEELSTESVDSKIENIVNLVNAGILTVDKNLEQCVRRQLRLPEL